MFILTFLSIKDRENEARFGATPVPGKIGMALAGQGLHAQPPPRSSTGGGNTGNQLYVGNVSATAPIAFDVLHSHTFPFLVATLSSWLAGPQRPFPPSW